MNFNDEQNNASDKHADDPVQSGQSEQNTIRILKPGSNNDLIDQLRGGPLDKTSVNYEYHSPDPTETAQRLALINYLNAGEEKMVPFELHIYQKGKHGLALADLRTDSKKDRSQSNEQAAT